MDKPRTPATCRLCGSDGSDYSGTAREAMYHYMDRTVIDLHRCRQAMVRAGLDDWADGLSHVIRHLEAAVAGALSPREH